MHRLIAFGTLLSVVINLNTRVNTQEFSSGSTGADGPLDVTPATPRLDVPANGVFNFTTINVRAGATLRFNRNSLNTPVYLLATGDVEVEANGTIDVSGGLGTTTTAGEGGPGGFDGAKPPPLLEEPGRGQGPGGGLGLVVDSQFDKNPGAYSSQGRRFQGLPDRMGVVYGSPLLVPLVGGSGGGAVRDPVTSEVFGGGGGGGAILMASSTQVTIDGRVLARGGAFLIRIRPGQALAFFWNPGSGGAIRLVAPSVKGRGFLDVGGGPWHDAGVESALSYGGNGRIRIDAIYKDDIAFIYGGDKALGGSFVSSGRFLSVFPPNLPTVRVATVGGVAIAQDPVDVTLPFPSSPDQPIRIDGTNVFGVATLALVLIPESGEPIPYSVSVDGGATHSFTTTINATFPINMPTRILAWLR